MALNIILLILGLVGLFFVLTFISIYRRAKSLSEQPTYSKRLDRAKIESGIYIEHGMVNKGNDKSVHAEYKLSDSFFESLH